jgi:hypothetical protein
MKIRPFRIPKAIPLPGVVIRVARAPRKDRKLEGDDASWAYDSPDGAATVYLAADIKSVARLRYLLYHELGHVINDMALVALRDYPDLFQPREDVQEK